MSFTETNIQSLAHHGESVKLIQLTDTHLCREAGGTLLGIDTDASLQAVIDLVKSEHSQQDLVLGTGDLSDNGSLPAYERVQSYFKQLDGEYIWLPGNHDDRKQMAEVVGDPARLCSEIHIGHWQLVALDSQIPGEVGGRLGEPELARLEIALTRGAENNLYSFICMHHQPVPVGCDWLDEQMVSDAGAFFDVLDRFPAVRGVLWGHVHQAVDIERNGVALMSSPSTCAQFAPDSREFRAQDIPPGYRWLELSSDGSISTGISRVAEGQFKVDLESGGYL